MSHFDDLPNRHRTHEVEDAAVFAFKTRLKESGSFIFQGADEHDYGTDCQIEVVDDGHPTNARVYVQIKGTEQSLNADGSVSISVDRTNLNYLLMQPYSFYACLHLPTGSLRICMVESLLRQYAHSGRSWMEQKSLTVTFTEDLTVERINQVAALARAAARASRDRRAAQTVASADELSKAVLDNVPEIHVPEERVEAASLLQQLYEDNADDVISEAFDQFAAILGADHDILGMAYMAEINLGMDNRSRVPERIKAAIPHFEAKIGGGVFQTGSLHYTIGNAYSALHDHEQAKTAYEAALDLAQRAMPELAAQVHKNLGTSLELLGQHDVAVEHYRAALQLSPDLPEAHNAMGNHYTRAGDYAEALKHFDQVMFADRNQGRTSAVWGWRANALFNLGEGRAAFREINALMGRADRHPWIWPWCFRLVASFGRTSVDNAVQARAFWQRYVRARPDHSQGWWELLMSAFYLRGQGNDLGKSYAEFKAEFDVQIANVDAADAALPWDRLGHWAQEDEDWAEAERCFRIAYDLEGGDYGFCLGCALNHLDRFEESLPILLEQAQTHQPDTMSWFHVGATYSSLGRPVEAIDAYERALALDPDYAIAMFDLGGTYWNLGDREKATQIWSAACARFPDDEHVSKVKTMLG